MRRLALVCTCLLVMVSAVSASPVQFARMPDLSPDGQLVAFSYLGDIWTVPSAGGTARLITMHEKHDANPLFSPDGKHLVFSSNRYGNYDLFVVPVEGGRPTRLTFDSADDHPTGWSPDGKRILFMSNRVNDFPSRVELWSVAKEGGMPRPIPVYEGREASWSPDGKTLAYVRGPGAWYRKGYRGSSNDDIWIVNADGTHSRAVATHAGQDNAPMWAPDGKHLYYVSDRFGVSNLVKQRLADDLSGPAGDPVALTQHTDERVRRARLGAGGQAIVYERGFDLWIFSIKDGKSRKLAIDASADEKSNPEKITTFNQGATQYAVSADEKFFTIVVQGEIFLLPRNGGKAKQLTDHPAFDHGAAWAPDSKRILFLSDRSGYEDIYALEQDDPDHPELTRAHRFKVTQLTKTPEPEMGVSFAPDGKRVAFLRAGQLITMNPDGSGEKILVPEGSVFDYEWSPDGQWICYARTDASFASELYIIPSTGPTAADPTRNVTRFANYNGGVTWSRTGNRLGFISRRGKDSQGAYILSLQKSVAVGASADRGFDWDGVHLRVKRPTPMSVVEAAISNDGSKIAFRSTQDGDDLWVAGIDGQVTRITTGSVRPTQIQWSRFFGTQLFFRDGNGQLRTASIGTSNTTQATAIIPFQARMTVSRDDLYTEVFDQSWRALSESFYDSKFHGANWEEVRKRFRPVVAHCAMKEDLYQLIFLMLGELNASHLGISGAIPTAESQQTADLGLIFDPKYTGPGLKIAEILKRGPADRRGGKLKPGDVIVAIDHIPLGEKVDPATLLNDKANETVALTILSNPSDPKSKRIVETQTGSRAAMRDLFYERWLEKNARQVEQLSKGQLGYIHIPSMDEAGLDRFLRALYSDNFDKDGIVLDVRFNGGGFTHESVLNYLLGKEHTVFIQRDGSQGLVLNSPDRKWHKPLVLLVNNRSYSDAEIFPHAFREYKLGKLVGQTTGGHVIGTRNIKLIDGSTFRTPRIGVTTNKGVNMEKEGVVPDVMVDIHPDQLARGEDPQIEKAVQVLLEDVNVWRKSHRPVALRPTPATPQVVRPMPKAAAPEEPLRRPQQGSASR